MFVPTVVPHAELVVPEDSIIQHFRGLFSEEPFSGTDSGPYFRKGGYMSQEYPNATYSAMVTRLDNYVGEIVAELKKQGVYDNTLIVFTSDNGPHSEGVIILTFLIVMDHLEDISVICMMVELEYPQ